MSSEAELEALLRWLAASQKTLWEVAEHIGEVRQQYGSTLDVQPRVAWLSAVTVMAQPPGEWAVNVALEAAAETPFPSLAWFAASFGDWVVPPRLFPGPPGAILTLASSDTFLSRILLDLPTEAAADVRPTRLVVSVQDMSKLT